LANIFGGSDGVSAGIILLKCVIRIPYRPSLDISACECGFGVGRSQEDELNILRRQSCSLQGADKQSVGVRPFGNRDLLPG
jgi:hypothetical protein